MGVAPYFCDGCKFETEEPAGHCPRCRRPLSKTSTVRRLGWVLAVLGGLLAAFMAWLTYVVAGLMARSDEPGAGARFTGDSTDAAFIYGIFGVVLALSVTFVLAGIWQIVYGRRNKWLVLVALVLAGVFWAVGEYVQTWE